MTAATGPFGGHPLLLAGSEPDEQRWAPDRLMLSATGASSSGVSGRNGGLGE